MGELYDRIASLCSNKGIKPGKMCNDLGISRGSIGDLKKGRREGISIKTATKIADYFGVTTDYLLTGEEIKKAPTLTKKDERDIERRLSAMIEDLNSPVDSLMFDGEPIDDETRQLLEISLRNQLEISKRIAKQRFTPKKYRKEGG